MLIPCHRVLRATGAFGGYRWGLPRKAALLAVEGARAENVPLRQSDGPSARAVEH
jgi:alkylated DNA nucleotide flippase Atl1